MKVLVADDDPVTRRKLSGLLEHLGHEPVEAHDGGEAWAAIQSEDAPTLIILDWMMPAPNGPEICRLVRSSMKRPHPYIIMLTARNAVEDVVEGMDSGADDYLRKPFDLRELRVRVRAGERTLAVQDDLRARAITDELTGLLNRRGISERIDHELGLVARDGRPLSVLIADIDNFKKINDSHGHAVGDEVLKEVSTRMNAQLRAYDDIGRYGGEEFVIVLPACEAAGALGVGERIRRAVGGTPVSTSAGPVEVTISVGTASGHGQEHLDTHGLLSSADRALYRAKNNGRNRVEAA